MEEDNPGKEQIATDLQKQLIKFAQNTPEEQKEKLPALVKHIKDVATINVASFLVDKEFQLQFEQAVNATLNTRFIVDGKEVKPWESGAVVALESTGQILGAVYNPTEELESYGDLTRYALLKAVYEYHLTASGKVGGLANIDNFNYLVGLGLKPFDDVFTGAFEHPVDIEGKTFYIGGSGCNAERGYLSDLLSGAQPTGDTQSGRFDRIFCRTTAEYLTGVLRMPGQTIPEPLELQELRINN